MSSSRLRILSVGGNAVSAFLSWRLQATNACDVTLVWKSGFENVSQYGISFRSKAYGNERFKPRAVVRSPEEASGPPGFDYVLLCVKALPDVYDLAAVIESVVTPQLTCIIVNTTNAIGIESYLESRFPTNVVLSLCSGVNINQLAASDFEHLESSEIWVGSTNQNPNIPTSVQSDMAEALALTLQSGNVDCHVSPNILQQQWERMMGPIAFHPLSVLTETPDLSALVEIPGMRNLVSSLLEELLHIAQTQGCSFPQDIKNQIFETMSHTSTQSTMYQDYISRRPMEVEVFLGSPIRMAKLASIPTPQLQTLYPLLCHLNTINQLKTPGPGPRDRQSSNFEPAPPLSPVGLRATQTAISDPPPGNSRPTPSQKGLHPSKRPPSSLNSRHTTNGDRGQAIPNGTYGSRRNSFDNDLEEFGHIVMYGDMLHTDDTDDMVLTAGDDRFAHQDNHHRQHLSIRERELQLKQRELALKEQELALQRNMRGNRRKGSRQNNVDYDDDDDDDEEYFGQQQQPGGSSYIHPDNIDMMSVTSRRNRRLPSGNSLRGNLGSAQPHRASYHGTTSLPKNRGKPNGPSATLIGDFPTPHSSIADDPLLNYASNRYPTLQSSRANSLTTPRFDDYAAIGNNLPNHNLPSRRASATPPYAGGYSTSSTIPKIIHK
ncbi:hypothetical protein TWF569_003034 [Orbilia oligospora]|uniref:Ketopantoate reductase C-terminal domain-containing protein n=1 Tax=Orbilia oligospora TaxID=2813651 RepID=A0A7C8J1D9_ORBOL|nr:hypothetical protein TWF102_002895 [Orbilia oligospora]KAF3079717.1 hypothetical protein TWF103_004746 [Orbilia oligospora]KAF3095112.1 hypothetical protein TWF706_007978 [Orbilia oligospora]KAF3120454.1 hypothetical protein TWF703_002612 [Orbilia oligospora]KAF3120774.1 hypothetical protein TWF594_003662 [Orbilia oligospora]